MVWCGPCCQNDDEESKVFQIVNQSRALEGEILVKKSKEEAGDDEEPDIFGSSRPPQKALREEPKEGGGGEATTSPRPASALLSSSSAGEARSHQHISLKEARSSAGSSARDQDNSFSEEHSLATDDDDESGTEPSRDEYHSQGSGPPSPKADTLLVVSLDFEGVSFREEGAAGAGLGAGKEAEVPGLALDLSYGSHLRIEGVEASGLVPKHNAAAPQASQVRAGDFIVKVNGDHHPGAMLKSLGEAQRAEMTISRPHSVVLESFQKGDSLGIALSFHPTRSSSLVVSKIMPSGTIPSWNAAAPKNARVQQNDYLVSVNGKSGNPQEMYEAIQAADILDLAFSRPEKSFWSRGARLRRARTGRRKGGTRQSLTNADSGAEALASDWAI